MTRLLIAGALALLMTPVFAADPPTWEPVSTDLIQAEKPGYGGLCGVLVDPASGKLYVNLSDRGIYVSGDQGKTWKKQSSQPIKGRTETPGCLMLDPTGKSKRLVMALVYGAPISVSADDGVTWTAMNGKSGHVDWFAADWTDPELGFILTLKHEAADLLLVSHDGGKSFSEVGKGYGPAWIFDKQTAVVAQAKSKEVAKPGLLRTTDGGKSFQPCGDWTARALPKWRNGTLYWVVQGALISSADQGQSWKKISDLKDGRYGPVFGKDDKQMFVLTGGGIVESTDGGGSWSAPITPPKDFKGISTLTWIEYDPRSDSLYMSKMGADLYRLRRGK